MKTFLFVTALNLLALTAFAESSLDQSFFSGTTPQSLREMDQATAQKWSQLEEWQQKSSWINEQVRLGVVGIVYEKGMFGTTVSRNIVPDKGSGWLVVDTVQVNGGPLLQLGNLAGNIFLQEMLPYVQGGANFERSYTNVRKRNSYKEALMANPFKFRSIPVNAAAVESFETGEIVSTITTGGVFVRAGASVFDLMGVSFADNIVGIGPKVKIHLNKSFKLTLAKENGSEILVMLEDVVDSGIGFGIAAGLMINDVIDAPVTIGINQDNGYSPIRVNWKAKREKLKSIIYKLDLSTAEGVEAYTALMARDLTVLDDLDARGRKGVKKELVRNGVRDTSEFNMGLDLIFYRSGYRSIYQEAKFNSTIAGGKKFRYLEIGGEKIKETSSWLSAYQRSEKYAALVPLSGADGGIILDSTFQFSDSDTNSDDLQAIVGQMKKTINYLPINPTIEPKKKYGSVKATVVVRFPAQSIRDILRASEKDIWRAVAVSAGLPNAEVWASQQGRELYIKDDSSLQIHPLTKEVNDGANYNAIQEGARIRDIFRKLRVEKDPVKKARMLVDDLRADSKAKLLHRVMVELAGRDQIFIRGSLKGNK